jgi:sortase A
MWRALAAIGRVLATAGTLILLFVAYQLWGTGIYEARAQHELEQQFKEQLHARAATPTTQVAPPTSTTPTTTTIPVAEVPPGGEAVAHLLIPSIGLDVYVVEGVDVADLRKGPGHYPGTPLPGQEGNAAIAGHRTTYGAPFGDLGDVTEGAEVLVRTLQGTFLYRVDTAPFAVSPNDTDVLRPRPDPARPDRSLATLTLTTCNPKYSAAQRLIVTGTLVLPPEQEPLPALPQPRPVTRISGLSGERASRVPALLGGLVVLAVGALWWLLFHRHPRWTTWLVGVVPFLVVLFFFYTYLERILPSNY